MNLRSHTSLGLIMTLTAILYPATQAIAAPAGPPPPPDAAASCHATTPHKDYGNTCGTNSQDPGPGYYGSAVFVYGSAPLPPY